MIPAEHWHLALFTLTVMLLGCTPENLRMFFYNPNVRGDPVSEHWITVVHPNLPVTFETPDNAVREERGSEGIIGMGTVFGPDLRADMVDDWGLRLVFQGASAIHAVEVEIRRLTVRNPDVTPETIKMLANNIANPDSAIEFLKDVYLDRTRRYNIVFTKLGPERIDGLPAQRFFARTDARVTEPKASYDVTVVARPPDEVWVIGARFDSESLPKERDEIYPRIMRSVHFTDAP